MLIISCFIKKIEAWNLTIGGLLFGILFSVGILLETFEREIVYNKKIIIKRLFSKDIEFSLSDIKFVEYRNKGYYFYDKYNIYKFKSSIKNGTYELIKIIEDNANLPKVNMEDLKTKSLIEIKDEIINYDYTDEEILAITRIGRDYRDEYQVRKRNLKIKAISIFIFICLMLILISILSSWIALVFIMLFPIPCLIGYFLCEDSLTSELKKDDFSLGINRRMIGKDSFNKGSK